MGEVSSENKKIYSRHILVSTATEEPFSMGED
jgi:hypothetical protein